MDEAVEIPRGQFKRTRMWLERFDTEVLPESVRAASES
jgi:hypothetical protein